MASVFISYAREDESDARRLAVDLTADGHEVWFDKDVLLPGQKWKTAIEDAIRRAQFVIAVLSPQSPEKRGYVQKELKLALELLDQTPDTQTFLIPARLADCEPQDQRLRDLQWVDLFPMWADGLAKIQRVLRFVPSAVLKESVAGTSWDMYDDTEEPDAVVQFNSDGTVIYDDDFTPEVHGSWKQAGDVLYFEFNKQYSQYKGII